MTLSPRVQYVRESDLGANRFAFQLFQTDERLHPRFLSEILDFCSPKKFLSLKTEFMIAYPAKQVIDCCVRNKFI